MGLLIFCARGTRGLRRVGGEQPDHPSCSLRPHNHRMGRKNRDILNFLLLKCLAPCENSEWPHFPVASRILCIFGFNDRTHEWGC